MQTTVVQEMLLTRPPCAIRKLPAMQISKQRCACPNVPQ